MSLDISGKLLSLFSSRVERQEDTYVVEIPANEVEEGEIEEGEVYRVGIIVDEDEVEAQAQTQTQAGGQPQEGTELQPPVEEGEIRYVEIEDIGKQGDGIARVERGYVIIVPGADMGDRVKVEVDEVKENFAVGEVLEEDAFE
ncbi:MAG: TRAM domain-containing protein [Halobacteria archaeon]|nr:TRAM domain-containing protein [Halobacteria archaeon]